MDQRTTNILFAFLRFAIRGMPLREEEQGLCEPQVLKEILTLSAKHDISHLVAFAIQRNGLIPTGNQSIEKCILKAVYRYEHMQYAFEKLCDALERAKIPFIPLKGAVLRAYYPEPWMRTSCDIDILIHRADLNSAISYLGEHLAYKETSRTTHDVSLYNDDGAHIELHFDLIEEEFANNAIAVLSTVWDHVGLKDGFAYWHEMSDAFFYFYHIAHMAKHFETGGFGIRPAIDLWILDHMVGGDISARDALLEKGDLLKFANVSRNLSEVWMDGKEPDALMLQLQDFLLHGGVFGTTDNRVALKQKKTGGRLGYIVSRMFIPYEKLKRYYPILEKHRWLMPVMQVRRWFMLLRPEIASMAKREIAVNSNLEKTKADALDELKKKIGLE